MLDQILSSSSQSSLLFLLSVAPERAFTVKELSGRLRLSQPAVSTALRHFITMGLVKQFSKGGHKYYLVNGKHKLFNDIRESLKKYHYEDELFSAIRRLGTIRAAFLSGIFTGQAQLPVDILLVGKVNLRKLEVFLAACKKLMGQDINYSVMTAEEFRIRRDTFDRFIKDIFDYRHLVVVDKMHSTKSVVPAPHPSKPTKPKKTHGRGKEKFKVSHF